jgi:hypothetical protein
MNYVAGLDEGDRVVGTGHRLGGGHSLDLGHVSGHLGGRTHLALDQDVGSDHFSRPGKGWASGPVPPASVCPRTRVVLSSSRALSG